DPKNGPTDRQLGGEFRALGLLGPHDDLTAEQSELESSGIAGFYDPATKELVVAAGKLTPFVRQVLVHELTHAVDDQHFDLNRPQLDADTTDEKPLAFRALAEGDATFVEDAYVGDMLPGDQRAARDEENAQADDIPDDIPDVLFELFGFPYDAGPAFIDVLH